MSFGEQLIAWRRELHQNPELSGQEVETTARLRQWLTNVDRAGGGNRNGQQAGCAACRH